MKTTSNIAVKDSIEAWELYCSGKYSEILASYQKTNQPDIQSLVALASLETDTSLEVSGHKESVFYNLKKGMAAWHNRDYQSCSQVLGQWLLSKDYFSISILERFCIAAERSNEWHMILKVAHKYFKQSVYRKLLAPTLIEALHNLEKYQELITLFEKHREILDSESTLHKCALAYIALGQYQEAENILLPLYQQVHGKGYQHHFEEYKKKYSDKKFFQKLANKKNKSNSEKMEVGLSLLFQGQYNKALQVFENINYQRA